MQRCNSMVKVMLPTETSETLALLTSLARFLYIGTLSEGNPTRKGTGGYIIRRTKSRFCFLSSVDFWSSVFRSLFVCRSLSVLALAFPLSALVSAHAPCPVVLPFDGDAPLVGRQTRMFRLANVFAWKKRIIRLFETFACCLVRF